jgi:hypothetical protein
MNFRETIDSIWSQAKLVTEMISSENQAEREELLPQIRELFEASSFIDLLSSIIERSGFAGDATPALASYVAMTSRMLKKPLNLYLIGQSGAGKNYAVNVVKQLFPDSSWVEVNAGSPGSFIYDDSSLVHRALIVTEADSIPQGDGAFASAIRTLFEENRLVYKTTIEQQGQRVSLEIVREGPVAVITTGVKIPETQTDSRMLPGPISDAPEHIANVSLQTAKSFMSGTEKLDLTMWQDFQRYLELGGPYDVDIPFAVALFQAMPKSVVTAPRWNRDFKQILVAIQSVTVLLQFNRKTENGHLIAELEDYSITRVILSTAFQTATSSGVTEADRAAYRVVVEHPGISNAELASALGIAASSSTYRVGRLKKHGLIANLASGNKTSLEVIAPLPDECSLPTLREVEAHLESVSNPLIPVGLGANGAVELEDSIGIDGGRATSVSEAADEWGQV